MENLKFGKITGLSPGHGAVVARGEQKYRIRQL